MIPTSGFATIYDEDNEPHTWDIPTVHLLQVARWCSGGAKIEKSRALSAKDSYTAYKLRQIGSTWSEIAGALGCSQYAAQRGVNRVMAGRYKVDA